MTQSRTKWGFHCPHTCGPECIVLQWCELTCELLWLHPVCWSFSTTMSLNMWTEFLSRFEFQQFDVDPSLLPASHVSDYTQCLWNGSHLQEKTFCFMLKCNPQRKSTVKLWFELFLFVLLLKWILQSFPGVWDWSISWANNTLFYTLICCCEDLFPTWGT